MTMTSGTDGGGGLGGTASSICAISQSDLVGTIGNLITRIEDLERAVSQMLGANVQAGQLSDLSEQVGWVYGVTYMGIPGWIQTEYGTLIPPPGFTLSGSGIKMWNSCTEQWEDFQAVIMDENGVLQFGNTTAGAMCGEKVSAWDAAAAFADPDYARVTINGPATGGDSMWQSMSKNVTLGILPSFPMTSSSGMATDYMQMRVQKDGLWSVAVSGVGVNVRNFYVGCRNVTTNAANNKMVVQSGPVPVYPDFLGSPTLNGTVVGEFICNSGDIIEGWLQGLGAKPDPDSDAVLDSFSMSIRFVAALVALRFVSAEIGDIAADTVAVTFSTSIAATGNDFKTGVTIKVNGTEATINTASRQSDHKVVYYYLSAPVTTGSVVTWEYDSTPGKIYDEGRGAAVELADVTPQTVTNNV